MHQLLRLEEQQGKPTAAGIKRLLNRTITQGAPGRGSTDLVSLISFELYTNNRLPTFA